MPLSPNGPGRTLFHRSGKNPAGVIRPSSHCAVQQRYCCSCVVVDAARLAAGIQGRSMRKLSDTIARLRALRSQPAGQGHHGVDRLSNLGDFGSNPGALQARTYLPRNLNAGAPLVVVLHGCTQTAAAYDHGSGWSHLADRHGFALLFAEQQRSNNANLCFNWFVEDDIKRDSGEALSIRQRRTSTVRQPSLHKLTSFAATASSRSPRPAYGPTSSTTRTRR